MGVYVEAESLGDPVNSLSAVRTLQLSKKVQAVLGVVLVGFFWWSQDRSAGPGKTWNTAVSATYTLSSFPVLLSHSSRTLLLPLSCMCMTTLTTHACLRSPSLHSTTQLFAMPVRQPHWPHLLTLSSGRASGHDLRLPSDCVAYLLQ